MFKKILFAFVLSTFLASGFALQPAHAFKDVLEEFADGVSDGGDVENLEGIDLGVFQSESGQDGLSGIVNAIKTFLDFFKLIVAPIAIIFMVITGVRMVSAGQESEEALTKGKTYMTYALLGLIVIFMADTIVTVFFGAEGEIFRGGTLGAIEFGRRSASLFEGIYSLMQVLITSLAVFFLVTAGFRYVAGSYSDDEVGKAKKQITWAIVGLFVIGVSEFIAKNVLFVDEGSDLGVVEAKQLFAQVTNFIAGTLGTLSFVFLIYAGVLYVSGANNEDNVGKAKKIMIGALLGLILASAAFAITNTVVELDTGR